MFKYINFFRFIYFTFFGELKILKSIHNEICFGDVIKKYTYLLSNTKQANRSLERNCFLA